MQIGMFVKTQLLHVSLSNKLLQLQITQLYNRYICSLLHEKLQTPLTLDTLNTLLYHMAINFCGAHFFVDFVGSTYPKNYILCTLC